MTHVIHPFKPVFDDNSKILILGSFPSVQSRKYGFYYGHPQNRFWKVISNLFCDELPLTIDEKTSFLLKHGIALCDVIYSCDIVGSSDSSIKNAVPYDLSEIFNNCSIRAVFANGQVAGKLFKKHFPNMDIIVLPSTSPANAAYTLDKLIQNWKAVL